MEGCRCSVYYLRSLRQQLALGSHCAQLVWCYNLSVKLLKLRTCFAHDLLLTTRKRYDRKRARDNEICSWNIFLLIQTYTLFLDILKTQLVTINTRYFYSELSLCLGFSFSLSKSCRCIHTALEAQIVLKKCECLWTMWPPRKCNYKQPCTVAL